MSFTISATGKAAYFRPSPSLVMLLKRVAHNVPAVIPFSQPPVALSPFPFSPNCRPDSGKGRGFERSISRKISMIRPLALLRILRVKNLFNIFRRFVSN